jgi:hypothetical protein
LPISDILPPVQNTPSEKEASNMTKKLEVVVIAAVDSARRPVDGRDV